MQIFLKLPTDKTLVYESKHDEKIINVKRQVIKRMRNMYNIDIAPMMVYSMYAVYNGKCLLDNNIIENHMIKDTTLHLHFRTGILKKNRSQEFIIHTNINDHTNITNLSVFCSPDDTIEYLIKYILEELHTLQEHDLTVNDVVFTYDNLLLHPKKEFGEYDQFSSSYIKFKQDDHLLNKTTIIGDFLYTVPNGNHCISVSNRKDKKPQLILKKANVTFPEVDVSCIGCDKAYHMITPCCRKRICVVCLKLIFDRNECICEVQNVESYEQYKQSI